LIANSQMSAGIDNHCSASDGLNQTMAESTKDWMVGACMVSLLAQKRLLQKPDQLRKVRVG